ncbi:MAG: hypothetical protein AAGE96_15440 [Cyanobacteria bacterium P01_G01_bin.19]
MKIIFQSEARTLSNSEIAKNQQDLIDLIGKLRRPNFRSSSKAAKEKCSS